MIKQIIYIAFFLLVVTSVAAQHSSIDSLQHEITISKNISRGLLLSGRLAKTVTLGGAKQSCFVSVFACCLLFCEQEERSMQMVMIKNACL